MEMQSKWIEKIYKTRTLLSQAGCILDENMLNSLSEKSKPYVPSASIQPQQDVIEVDEDSDVQVIESTPMTSGTSSTFHSPAK
jgi:hypothetical protein